MWYNIPMTKTLDTAFEAAKTLPESCQDDLAKLVLDVVKQNNSSSQLSTEQNAEVRRRVKAAELPVSVAAANAFFKKFA